VQPVGRADGAEDPAELPHAHREEDRAADGDAAPEEVTPARVRERNVDGSLVFFHAQLPVSLPTRSRISSSGTAVSRPSATTMRPSTMTSRTARDDSE